MNTIIIQQENQIEWGVLNAEFLQKNKAAYKWLWDRIVTENEQGLRHDSPEAVKDAKQRLAYWSQSDIEILSQEYLRLQEFKAVKDNRTKDFKYYIDEANN